MPFVSLAFAAATGKSSGLLPVANVNGVIEALFGIFLYYIALWAAAVSSPQDIIICQLPPKKTMGLGREGWAASLPSWFLIGISHDLSSLSSSRGRTNAPDWDLTGLSQLYKWVPVHQQASPSSQPWIWLSSCPGTEVNKLKQYSAPIGASRGSPGWKNDGPSPYPTHTLLP